jgi:hypothetical protein
MWLEFACYQHLIPTFLRLSGIGWTLAGSAGHAASGSERIRAAGPADRMRSP